jgi:hypothetical protein
MMKMIGQNVVKLWLAEVQKIADMTAVVMATDGIPLDTWRPAMQAHHAANRLIGGMSLAFDIPPAPITAPVEAV